MEFESMRPDQGSTAPTRRSPDWWLFFLKVLKQGANMAARVPSSRWMARAVVGGIDFDKSRCVVELGAGTGPITAELIRQSQGRCRLLIIERDADFCKRLRQRFPDADIVEADAGDLDKLLNDRGIQTVDHVLCGLPLPSFTPADRDHIMAVVQMHLRSDGSFRQLTHLPWVYYPLYRRYFARVAFQMVFRNLPPAGFYVCQGPRALVSEGATLMKPVPIPEPA